MAIAFPAEMEDNSTVVMNTTGAPEKDLMMRVWVHIIYISAPIIVIVGVVGNALTVVVMITTTFRRVNTSVYLTALAISDTICLFCQRLTRSWLEFVLDLCIDVISRGGCKALMFIHFSMSCTSSWLIVTMTMERLIVVWHPLQAKRICTRRRALAVVCSTYLISFASNTYALFTFDRVYEPSDGYYYCLQQNERNQFISTLIDFCLYSFFPSIFLWILNVLLIEKMRKSKKIQRALTIRVDDDLTLKKSRKSDTNLMLLVVSFTFLFLTTPTALFQLIQSLSDIPNTPDIYVVREVLNVLSSTNHAINFFLYCTSGPKFRRELMKLFRKVCCRKSAEMRTSSSFTLSTPLEKSRFSSQKSIYIINDEEAWKWPLRAMSPVIPSSDKSVPILLRKLPIPSSLPI